MKNLNLFFLFGSVVILTGFNFCSAGQSVNNPAGTTSDSLYKAGIYTLEEAFPALKFEQPVELTSPNDNTKRIFVVAQKGTIHVVSGNLEQKEAPVFLDMVSRVESGGEKGLLGLAFHPDYKTNGYFYVNYTHGNPLETNIARYKVNASNPNIADPASETILLRYTQPFPNHNGGKVAFGNDGYLYIAAGDGGSGGDPGNRAQNTKEVMGKILRIDVNKISGSLAYAIPADNMFAGNQDGSREEIYALGMRNPWRFSFDKQTGTLWAGDVGQNKIEEIDIIDKGGNYGWRIREGNDKYKGSDTIKNGLIDPIWSYEHSGENGNSVTGGYVCRDKNLPELAGKYIFGDYTSGNVWALTFDGKKAIKNELIAKLVGGLSSFGEDSQSNLYLLAHGTGRIYKLIRK